MLKQLRQVAGVQQVKVESFKKGIFALTPKKGVRLSENAVSEAVRRSGFSMSKLVTPNGHSSEGRRVTATPPDEVDKLLANARTTFHDGNFQRAAKMALSISNRLQLNAVNSDKKTDAKSESRHGDALQFLSLVSFSRKNYEEAARHAHLAIHRGSPWNWKALSNHYKKIEDYTSQLKELEKSIQEKSTVDKRFLIGYHYHMQGHKEAARKQLEIAQKEQPQNEVIQTLLLFIKKERNDDSKNRNHHPHVGIVRDADSRLPAADR